MAELKVALARKPILGHARNVIVFIGDGMGVSTITAARILEGQQRGRDGESNVLTMDTFPYVGLSKTYSNDGQVSDSAATATALFSGVKTNNGVLGASSRVELGNCSSLSGHAVTTIFESAEHQGLATGIVSTAALTNATPAAAYGHSADRNWEASAPAGCRDLADQLLNWTAGDGFEVALGGGRSNFTGETTADPEDAGKFGVRPDGRNLIDEWTAKSTENVYVWNTRQLESLPVTSGQRVLGLFDADQMEFEAERPNDAGGEPSLAEMTDFAIKHLLRSKKGFVLMVEGGRIDHAHHVGMAKRALLETIAFDAAIKVAIDLTSREDTLIVVTADHSHTLTIGGSPDRGNPILGLVRHDGLLALAEDGKPYTTLQYANGPGAASGTGEGARPDLSNVDTTALNYRQIAAVPLRDESHGGEDVPVFASGPMAHLLTGTIEENYVYQVLAYALGWVD